MAVAREAQVQGQLTMVKDLEDALREDIRRLDWMTPTTKERALAKLAVIDNKIGYPAHPRDYASVEIRPRDLVGNVQRVFAYESRRDLASSGCGCPSATCRSSARPSRARWGSRWPRRIRVGCGETEALSPGLQAF
jgi:hypothetical protein